MARKYLIETFGCQMNVHDSERMAGLLEQAGYEPTDDDRRRRRRRHQHLQRARAGRGEALHAARRAARAWATRPGRDPSSPSPAASRSRKASALLQALARASSTSSSARRASSGCRCSSSEARAGRQRAVAPVDRPRSVRRRVVSARGHAARRSGQGLRHDHRRLQRVLQLLRRAVHARPRADAAEGRHPGRGPRGGGDRAPRSAAARADRQSLPGARRSGVRLRRAARGGQRRRRASSASGSPARIRGMSRRA